MGGPASGSREYWEWRQYVKHSQRLQVEQSEKREKINLLLAKETMTDEERTELAALTVRIQTIEPELRAALVTEGEAESRARNVAPDAEVCERIELRSKARLTGYLLAALKGRVVDGAEPELAAAAGVGGIPLELWDIARPDNRSAEERAVAAVPGSVGVNLDPIRPAVFANSIAARLGIDMPRVMSGTYATATISTSQSAAARTKSAAAAGIAGAITAQTATPKSVSARLELTIEDIAAVGTENFEAALRENLALALSDELDDQAINGDGNAPNLTGIFQRLTDPSAPAANAETWTRFLAIQASGIDGLWANMLSDVAMVVNPETYRLAAVTFQGADAEESAASYMTRQGGGFWTNKRMPAKAAHIAQGILYRSGRSGMGASMGMRTAVCPHWNEISIDDIYTGSAKGERYFTMHVLLGDVILVQPDAYAQVAFRVST